MRLLFAAVALTTAFTSQAAWQLDPAQSQLRFVSVKNGVVAEVHKFSQLSGNWAADGKVTIQIPVATLDTMIPIRNERIWQYVLQAELFSAITVSAELNQDSLAKLAIRDSMLLELPLNVTIATETVALNAKLRITKLSANTLQAVTEAPLMLNTSSFKLTDGVAKLQELAGLNSIDALVPVSFTVRFNQQ